MSDKTSKKLAKQMARKIKKQSPNRKLKRNMIVAAVILFGFMMSRPLSSLTAKSSFGSLTKVGTELQKTDEVSVKYAGGTAYKDAQLVEIDLLVDLPASQVNMTINPTIYGTNKKKISDIKVEKINANFYAVFIPKSNIGNFQYYVAVPETGNSNDTYTVGDATEGFIITPKNVQEKQVFDARTLSSYVQESRTLLTQKYQKQLTDIDHQVKDLNQQITDIQNQSQQLLNNTDGLTQSEKQQIADQISSNNDEIKGIQTNITSLKQSKQPIENKIAALQSLN